MSIIKINKLLSENRGTVAVEFAIFLPLLLLFFFGTIELGSAWYFKQMLVNASREGARLGAMYDGYSDSAVQAEVVSLLSQSGYPGSVSVSSSGASGATGTLVQVDVTSEYQLPVLGVLVPSAPTTLTLRATSVMRHE